MFNRKPKPSAPPIFADLVLEVYGTVMRVDVERDGWLQDVQPLYAIATRAGLILRRSRQPNVWLTPNGAEPRYLSRVVGKIDGAGQCQMRVAGLQCGDVGVWLHSDGLVEVGPEPTFRGI